MYLVYMGKMDDHDKKTDIKYKPFKKYSWSFPWQFFQLPVVRALLCCMGLLYCCHCHWSLNHLSFHENLGQACWASALDYGAWSKRGSLCMLDQAAVADNSEDIAIFVLPHLYIFRLSIWLSCGRNCSFFLWRWLDSAMVSLTKGATYNHCHPR